MDLQPRITSRTDSHFQSSRAQSALQDAGGMASHFELGSLRVETVLDKVALYDNGLRSFTTTIGLETGIIDRLRRFLPHLAEVSMPATDYLSSLQGLEGFERLTLFDIRTEDSFFPRTPPLQALPQLKYLALTLTNIRRPMEARRMVKLELLPKLVEIRVIAFGPRPPFHIFSGISHSIQQLVLDGPFDFPGARALHQLFCCVAGSWAFRSLSCRDLRITYQSTIIIYQGYDFHLSTEYMDILKPSVDN